MNSVSFNVPLEITINGVPAGPLQISVSLGQPVFDQPVIQEPQPQYPRFHYRLYEEAFAEENLPEGWQRYEPPVWNPPQKQEPPSKHNWKKEGF